MVALNDKKRASNEKYLQQLEDIKIRVPKGYREIIQDLAKNEGFNAVNPFVISLINKVLRSKNMNEIPTGIKETKEKSE